MSKLRDYKKLKSYLLFTLSLVISGLVCANPVLNNVGSGNVTIQQQPNSTVINQSSSKAIINWRSFNINHGETTHFQQPTGGIILNRIDGTQGASQIFGQLTATGKIILVNPAGIYFGPSAYVNVGGLIASTADIRDQDFLNGNYKFSQPSPYSGAIVNEGQIIARDNGLVALLGNGVVNNGYIEANLGKVVLASGETFTLNFSGDNLINFSIDSATTHQPVDRNGKPLTNGVQNTGAIIANGGKVMVAAKSAKGVLDNVINMEGLVQAKSVAQVNGEIILSGDLNAGVVRVKGKLIASGISSKQSGGKVQITGNQILIDSGTEINVSGDAGGGMVNIGGNAHGAGSLPHANAVVMMPTANIMADAITSGNGGQIVLWSDGVTRAFGSLSAHGGLLNGNGGFIETSGHYLDIGGIKVNTAASHGQMGTWLLDPYDVYITNTPPSSSAFTTTFTPTADDSNVYVGDIISNLANNSVTITTTGAGAQLGDIYVNTPITSWSSANNLSLTANGSVYVNQAITWTGTGTLNLTAGNKIFLNSDLSGVNGSLVLSAANSAQSITSGSLASPSATGVTANINVKNFNLSQGQWYQNNASLPTFTASNNFQVNSGAMSPTGVEFLRVTGGTGAALTPYLVQDIYAIQGINSSTNLLSKAFLLTADISNAGVSTWNSAAGWIPIGNGTVFSGIFDGGNHTINGLYINRTAVSQGFFGTTGTGSIIKNFALTNVSLSSFNTWQLGAIAGVAQGAISNVAVTGLVRAWYLVGGLVGVLQTATGSISNSWVSVAVSSGYGPGLFQNGYAGGIAGAVGAGSTITKVMAYGSVAITQTQPRYAGGIAGSNAGLIDQAYAQIYIPLAVSSSYLGGLVGINSGTIQNSVSASTINAQSALWGGIVGSNEVGSSIINSISYGYVGGVAGGVAGGNAGTITNSFWNTETTGQASSAGSTGAAGYRGMTSAEMKNFANFQTGSSFIVGAGYDISGSCGGVCTNTWATTTGSFPYLNKLMTGNTPQVISGTDTTNLVTAQVNVYLVNAGTVIDSSAFTLANKSYYLLEGNFSNVGPTGYNTFVSSGTPLMVYFNSYGAGASRIFFASSDMTSTNIATGQLTIDSNFSNSLMSQIVGSLSSVYQLYTASGNNITMNPSFAFNASNFTLNGNITDTNRSITFNNATTLSANSTLATSNQAVTFNGNVNSSGGANNLSVSTGAGAITLATMGDTTALGVLSFTGPVLLVADTVLNSTGNMTFSSTINGQNHALTLNSSGATSSIAGIISNLTAFNLNGSTTLTLSGANTYTGLTTVNGGILRSGAANVIADADSIVLNAGTSWNLNNFSETVASITGSGNITLGSGTLTINASTSPTYSGSISGTGGLTKNGTGNLTLLGTNNYTGATTVSQGTLTTGAANIISSSSALSVASLATFDLNNFNQAVGSIAGAGNIALGSASLTAGGNNTTTSFTGILSGNSAASLTKAGTGTLTLSGVNTYGGGTSITAGTITINTSTSALGTGAVSVTSGAALNISASTGTILNNLTLNGTGIASAGALINTGTNTLSGAITLGSASSISTAASANLTLSGPITGTGTNLTKIGTGTLTLSGNNSAYTGTTTVSAGTLAVSTSGTALGSGGVSITSGAVLSLLNTLSSALNNNLTINGTGIASGGALVDAGSNAINGTVTMGSSSSINVSGASDALSLNSTVSGAFTLTKIGLGNLTLAGANSYSNGTTVSAGTLTASTNATALGTNTVTVSSGASLAISGSLSGTLANNLNINGTGATGAGGVLVATGTNTLSGTVTMSGASTVKTTNSLDSLTLNGVVGGAFAFTKAGLGTLILGNTSNTYTGSTIVSAGILSAANVGNSGAASSIGTNQTVTLGTASTAGQFNYTGSTASSNRIFTPGGVAGGVLQVNNSGQTFTLTANQALGANPMTYSTVGNLILSGIVSGSGGIIKNGAGTLSLNNANSFSTAFQIQAGLVNVNNNAGLGTSSVSVSSGAVLALNNVTIGTNGLNIAASGTLAGTGTASAQGNIVLANNTIITAANASDSLTLSGVISGNSLTKSGLGTLTLSGNNSYTSGTNVTAGTLRVITSSNALGTGDVTVATGAAINLVGTLSGSMSNNFILNGTGIANAGPIVTTGINTINGSITFGNAASINVTNNVDTLTVNGLIYGTAGFTKLGLGNLILSAPNTYSGTTTIAAGKITLGGSGAIPATSSLSIASGATFNLNNYNENLGSVSGLGTILLGTGTLTVGSDNSSSTFDGSIQGSGNLTKAGSGNLILTNNNTLYSGLTTINAGTLTANSNNAIGTGNAAINAGGMLTLSGITLNTNTITLNGGTLNAVGPSTITGNIVLNTDSAISSDNTFNLNTISGNYRLSLLGTGTNVLNGAVNVASITTGTTGSVLLNINSINTSGSQTYQNNVILNNDTSLSGSSISFTNSINGLKNLSLTATNMTINALVNLNNVSFTGASANNTVTLDTRNNQTWNITANNSGNFNATGIASGTFSNVQNLVGGLSDDTFTIGNGVKIGNIDGGAIGSTMNTIDYSAFTASIKVSLGGSIFDGTTSSSQTTINNFNNINSLVANGPNNNSITLPVSDSSANVVVTGPYKGYINDPLFYSGFGTITDPDGNGTVVFPSNVTVITPVSILIDGEQMNFYGFNLNYVDPGINNHVAQVITVRDYSSSVTDTTGISLNNSINESLNKVYLEYENYLKSLKIVLNCGGGSY